LALNNQYNKVTIADAGGKVAIESAIQNHPSNVRVHEKGKRALHLLNHI
jgi:hypothetical protein